MCFDVWCRLACDLTNPAFKTRLLCVSGAECLFDQTFAEICHACGLCGLVDYYLGRCKLARRHRVNSFDDLSDYHHNCVSGHIRRFLCHTPLRCLIYRKYCVEIRDDDKSLFRARSVYAQILRQLLTRGHKMGFGMVEWNVGVAEDSILADVSEVSMINEDTTQFMYAEDNNDAQHMPNDTVLMISRTPAYSTILSSPDIAEHCESLPKHTPAVSLVPVHTKTRGRKHAATAISVLNAHFDSNRKPSYFDKQKLAMETGISLDQVNMWFNNKRKRA